MQLFAKVLRKLRVARYFNQRVKLVENGREFMIPLLGDLGYSNLSLTEPWMTVLFKRLSPIFEADEFVFVDVGVNIGQTLLKLRSVFPDARYVGFEPNPTCVYYVNTLIDSNAFQNVSVFPVGISSTATVLSLNLYGEQSDDSAASLIENFRPEQRVYRSIHVPVFPVELITIPEHIGFLKIDVEGAELEVLRGFAPQLREFRPVVLTEILPVYKEENLTRLERQESIERMMRDLDYRCYRAMHPAGVFSELVSIDRIGIHASVEWSDYLWVPAERDAMIRDWFSNK
ncbi:MAG: FkbM family methyltransferase [Pirellula sp.]|jgi:FkbM family methyltransferase